MNVVSNSACVMSGSVAEDTVYLVVHTVAYKLGLLKHVGDFCNVVC